MVVIAVAGSASRSVPPERGTLRLRVVGEGDGALDVVVPLLARLVGEARAHEAAGAVTRWSAESLATSVEHRWRGDREERVRTASAPLEVRFRDLAAMLGWLGGLADEEAVRVDGVDWTVTAATRSALERELRGEAVADAVERADDYAAALGIGAVRAVRLEEAGLRGERGGTWTAQGQARTVDGPRLHPAPVELAVRITADFEPVRPGSASASPGTAGDALPVTGSG